MHRIPLFPGSNSQAVKNSVQGTRVSATAARDGRGHVLPDLKQARIKALQKDLLNLVKEAENCGAVKVTRRKATISISMPGLGVLRLVPEPRTAQIVV